MYGSALIIYTIQEVLDQIDGKIAHVTKTTSAFGVLFDPFADAVVRLTAFACLMQREMFPLWAFALLITGELFMMFLRQLGLLKKELIGSSHAGKIKSFTFTAAISLLLWWLYQGSTPHPLALWAAIILPAAATLVSGMWSVHRHRSLFV